MNPRENSAPRAENASFLLDRCIVVSSISTQVGMTCPLCLQLVPEAFHREFRYLSPTFSPPPAGPSPLSRSRSIPSPLCLPVLFISSSERGVKGNSSLPLRTGIPALPFCHVTLKATKPRKDYPRELNTLGDHLRRKRREYGLFAKTVAQKLGCIQPPWVTGRTGAPLLLSTSCSASSVFWATDPICPGGVLGAIGRYGSLANIERLWRTLKDSLRRR